ncbi:MAG: TraB/GumN family protein [Pseudomonadota bacterium]
MNRPVTALDEPLREITLGSCHITLLGTAHVSRASEEAVRRLIPSGQFDAVAVELCPSRHAALKDPDALARMDLLQVVREGKMGLVAANLALTAYQQRLADQLGVEPGAELRAALEAADGAGLPVVLIDREVGITLRRLTAAVRWWQRPGLIAGLMASLLTREEIAEEDIERLKMGDILHNTFADFADQAEPLYRALIGERDEYMALKLREYAQAHPGQHILAVVGAGHLDGIVRHLETPPSVPPDTALVSLVATPPRSRLGQLLPWMIMILILGGFVVGFVRGPELGWQLVLDWTLTTGGLAAVGALIALAHPVTLIGSFLAAPITTLHPLIGAGMVAVALELWLRKPRVADFATLREDVAHISGWWRNRVAHTFLVFMLVNLGASMGTYVGGFRLFGQLTGHG